MNLAHNLPKNCSQITLNLLAICSKQVFNSFKSCFQPSQILIYLHRACDPAVKTLLVWWLGIRGEGFVWDTYTGDQEYLLQNLGQQNQHQKHLKHLKLPKKFYKIVENTKHFSKMIKIVICNATFCCRIAIAGRSFKSKPTKNLVILQFYSQRSTQDPLYVV